MMSPAPNNRSVTGNRPFRKSRKYRYGNNGNKAAFAHDDGRSQTYTHDRESRLVASDSVTDVAYIYDFSGRLLLRILADGSKEKFYYDGINQLAVHEKPSGGTWRTKKINFLKDASIGQIIAHRTYTYSGSSVSTEDLWYHYDMLGNVTALTNSNYDVEALYDMEAFGTVKTGAQDGVHLTTKEYDSASGLYYFGARWYDKDMGRWIEKEPLGFDGPNLYFFNYNTPTKLVDPTGLFSEDYVYSPPGAWNPYIPPDSDGDGMSDPSDPHPDNPSLPVNAQNNCPKGPGFSDCYWRCREANQDDFLIAGGGITIVGGLAYLAHIPGAPYTLPAGALLMNLCNILCAANPASF